MILRRERGVARGFCYLKSTKDLSLVFADDTLLFCHASVDAAREIVDVLHRFCLASGQEINLKKSTVVFSRNAGESEGGGGEGLLVG